MSATVSDEPQIASDLVDRIRKGDGKAETELWNRYNVGLLYLLKRRTNDPELAQDLRQETFRIALVKLRASGLDDSEKLAAYLRGIAVNLVSGDWRKRARQNTTADSDLISRLPDERSDPANSVYRSEKMALVRQLIQQLPMERDRQLLMQYCVYDVDKESICEDLDISSMHFNRVLFRARNRLKKLLSEKEQMEGIGPNE